MGSQINKIKKSLEFLDLSKAKLADRSMSPNKFKKPSPVKIGTFKANFHVSPLSRKKISNKEMVGTFVTVKAIEIQPKIVEELELKQLSELPELVHQSS